jgi:integrase
MSRDGIASYHVQVRVTGFPSRTASFKNLRQAQRWGATVEAQMIEGRHFRGTEARRHTLGEAIDRYLENEAPKLRNGKMHRSALPWWRSKLGHLKLADINPALIVEHRDKLSREPFVKAKPDAPHSELGPGEKPRQFHRKPNTINNYLRALSRVFSLAKREWHWITVNPMEGVSKLNPGKARIRYLTEEERARLLEETAKDPQLHTLVVLALATAARAGELLKMSWADVELNQGRAILHHTKNDEARAVWLHEEAVRLLTEHKARGLDPARVFVSERGSRYDYFDPFKDACARAGVSNFRFHDLRHSAATYLARAGATERQLRAIGGWKSDVASRYVHLAAEDAKAVLQRMNNEILGKPDKL